MFSATHIQNMGTETVLLLLAAYFLGGIPCGLIVGKIYGVDVRQKGSGNIGATNVSRTVGKPAGVLTLLLDIIKGILTTYLPQIIGVKYIFGADAIAGTCAVLGHCYSPFLLGAGGKGVATALGVIMSIAPFGAFMGIIIFLISLAFTKTVSLASLCSVWGAALIIYNRDYQGMTGISALIIAVLITLRHKTNIRRLRAGTEPRIGR